MDIRPMPDDWMPDNLVINAEHMTEKGPLSMSLPFHELADSEKIANDPMLARLRESVWQYLELLRLSSSGDLEARLEIDKLVV